MEALEILSWPALLRMRVGWNFNPLCIVLEKGLERAAYGQEKGLS